MPTLGHLAKLTLAFQTATLLSLRQVVWSDKFNKHEKHEKLMPCLCLCFWLDRILAVSPSISMLPVLQSPVICCNTEFFDVRSIHYNIRFNIVNIDHQQKLAVLFLKRLSWTLAYSLTNNTEQTCSPSSSISSFSSMPSDNPETCEQEKSMPSEDFATSRSRHKAKPGNVTLT